MFRSWAGFVARHPMWITVVCVAVLAPLVVPALSLRFGQEDIGAASPETTERQAYDLITAGFGVGYNGPLQVAAQLDPVASPSDEYTRKYDKAKALQRDLEKKSKQLPKQQQRLEAQQRELEAEQRQLETEGEQLQAQEQQLEVEQNQLEARGAALQRQAAALTDRAARLDAEKTRLQQAQRGLEAEQARLEARRDALRQEARALAAEIRPLARRLGELLIRERILRRRIEQLDDNPVLQAILKERLQRVLARQQEVRAELAPLVRQARRLADQARQLAAHAARLQARADQLQARADQLRAAGSQLQAQGARLAQERTALQQQASALERQAEQLQQTAAGLERQRNQLQREGARLQRQADQLKAEQRQAEREKRRAEKLQRQLTNLVTAAGGDPRNTDPRVVALQDGLSETPGVVALTPPQTNQRGDVVMVSAIPSTGPATEQTAQLLETVRGDVVPSVDAGGGITSYVGGYTASYVDLATLISKRLLLVIGTVILLGFLLLMLAFRSLLIPLQAAITNVASAAAAFGILTAAFQWGWGISLVGIDTASDTVPIASYVPLMLFAILFGLSMDYEVFLVSHIQQHHLGGEPARQAATSGLTSVGRITTAACLIMTSVFASFILNGDPTIKQFGVGLASAVLLAGFLVVTLAPATIMLMGEAAWWLPKWLDRLLPHIDIEGGSPPEQRLPSPLEDPDGGGPVPEVPVPSRSGGHRAR